MTNASIQNQLPVFLGLNGSGLNGGKIYIGLPNQDPQTFPKPVYWDEAGTDPVDQTNGIQTIGGYITRAGTPATIYQDGAYSIRVLDRSGAQVFYFPEITDPLAEFIASLDASSGSGLIGFSHAETYPDGTVGKHLQAFVCVTDAPYNAVGDGVTDDTTAFEAAFATGRAVYAPARTYILDRCEIPNGNGFTLYGEGPYRTIFQAGATNQPVFVKKGGSTPTTDDVADHGYMGHFSLKAHAAGSTGPAFECTGFRNFKFERIMGQANGSGAFESLFEVSSTPRLTYGVTWEHCGVAGQAGFDYAWKFTDGGLGFLYNSNNVRILSPWVYANSGMIAGIDIANCSGYEIAGGLVESAGDYGIILGARGHVHSVWLESSAIAPVKFQNTESVTSSNNVLEAVFFSGFGGDIPIPDGCENNLIQSIRGAFTFSPVTAADNNIFISTSQGGEATVAKVFGVAGTLTKISDEIVSPADGTRKAVYTFQASSGTPSIAQFSVTPPSGYAIRSMTASYYDAANSVPGTVSIENTLTGFIASVPNTNLYQIVLLYRYQ